MSSFENTKEVNKNVSDLPIADIWMIPVKMIKIFLIVMMTVNDL